MPPVPPVLPMIPALAVAETRVLFPAGGLTAETTVLGVVDLAESGLAGTGLITDASPFHPIDHGWPDQGPDRGTVTINGSVVEVVDVVVGATQGANLFIATNIPVRRGEPGWVFVVVHVLAPGASVPSVGERVELQVDAAHRLALSAGHTGCHVAALALNAALADRWSKPVAVDGLGHPDFDQLALTTSKIDPDGSTDRYRLGKSLRKRGFDSADLAIDTVTAAANAVLAGWVAAGASIRIETGGNGLTDRRTWVCELPEGQQRTLCGGTHLTSLNGVTAIEVELRLTDAELTMETKVTRR